MRLEEYIEKIDKDACPKECEFQSKEEIEIAKVPPPKGIVGIIISRDPTTNWRGYKDAKNLPNDERRRKLFKTAIPQMLVKRIENLGKDTTNLSNTIYEKVYWTHLHKCFADEKEEKSIKFKNENAQKCADKWLTKELNTALSYNPKFIIALGKDVQKWVCEWREDYYDKSKNLKIIYLPHPSPANVGNYFSWRPQGTKDKEKLEKRINGLLDLCK